ncbi:MAG: hypothetical protein AAF488_16265, partial [Planctomycetota bacterium]
VGIVQFGSGATPYALVNWSSPDAPVDSMVLARSAAQRAGLDPERTRLVFDNAVTAGYESRFYSAAVEAAGTEEPPVRARLLRVRGVRAEFFDPTSADEWRRFFDEEKVRLSGSSMRGRVNRTVGVLIAERFGAEIGRSGSVLGRSAQSSNSGDASTLTFDLNGSHPKRGDWVSAHTMTLSGAKLDRLRAEFRWKKGAPGGRR